MFKRFWKFITKIFKPKIRRPTIVIKKASTVSRDTFIPVEVPVPKPVPEKVAGYLVKRPAAAQETTSPSTPTLPQ